VFGGEVRLASLFNAGGLLRIELVAIECEVEWPGFGFGFGADADATWSGGRKEEDLKLPLTCFLKLLNPSRTPSVGFGGVEDMAEVPDMSSN
jgi:hypothetical protein